MKKSVLIGIIAGTVVLVAVIVGLVIGLGPSSNDFGDGVTTTTGNNQPNPGGHTHIVVVDAAVAPTCTATGLTEGSHCSECGETIVAQQEEPIVAHTYDDIYDDECNVCGHKRDAECAHLETEVIPGKEATCTESGLTDGAKCKKCQEIVTMQMLISMKDHVEVIDEAVDATCQATGLTQGKHCEKCETVLVARRETPIIDHIEGDWIIDKSASKSEDGKKHTECTMCEKPMSEEVIPATGSVGLAYTVNSDGKSCTITGIGECTDSHVLIPSVLDGYSVTEIAKRAFYDCDTITEITIPASVKTIGTQIFYNADNLNTVYYNSTYYSSDNAFLKLPQIKKVVFNGPSVPYAILKDATNITDIVIGDNVQTIGGAAFSGCTSLKSSITIPASVTKINREAFSSCDFSDVYYTGDLEGWLNIIFDYNSSSNPLYKGANLYINNELVTSVTIPDTVTTIGEYTFYGCQSLTDVTLGSSVESIGEYAFSLSSIKSITIPHSVTSIDDYAFRKCTSLEKIIIPDSVESLGFGVFELCTSLTQAELPDSIDNIRAGLFSGCSALKIVNIPDSVTSIGNWAFENCTSLESITIPESASTIGTEMFKGCSSLKSIIIPDSWTEIRTGTFQGCSSLLTVKLGNGITRIRGHAFDGCISLFTITLPASLTSVDNSAFLNCHSFIEVCNKSSYNVRGIFKAKAIITDESESKLKYVGDYVFYDDGTDVLFVKYLGSDTEIVLPEYDGGKEYVIYQYAFYENSKITSVVIPDCVTSVGIKAFYDCDSLVSVKFGNSVTDIGEAAFIACDSLVSVKFGNSVTNIGDSAFRDCDLLESITLPDSLKTIGSSAFSYCTAVKNVTLGNSIKSINQYAFFYCTKIEKIIIPKSVTAISAYAFRHCIALTRIEYEGTVKEWNAIRKEGNWDLEMTAYTVYCTDGSISK